MPPSRLLIAGLVIPFSLALAGCWSGDDGSVLDPPDQMTEREGALLAECPHLTDPERVMNGALIAIPEGQYPTDDILLFDVSAGWCPLAARGLVQMLYNSDPTRYAVVLTLVNPSLDEQGIEEEDENTIFADMRVGNWEGLQARGLIISESNGHNLVEDQLTNIIFITVGDWNITVMDDVADTAYRLDIEDLREIAAGLHLADEG